MRIILSLSILFLLACSSAPKDKIFHHEKSEKTSVNAVKEKKNSTRSENLDEENDAEKSMVRTVKSKGMFELPVEAKIVSGFGALKNAKGVSMFKTKKRWRFPEEILLPPGDYSVDLNCAVDGGNMYGHRKLTIKVEPKKDYTLFCLGAKGRSYYGINTYLNFYPFFSETKDVEQLTQQLQNKIDDSSGLDLPVGQGKTRLVFFNDTVSFVEDPTFGLMTLSLDKNNTRHFQRGQYFSMEVPNGTHSLDLNRKEIFNFHNAYELNLNGGVVYVRVSSTVSALKYEIMTGKPANFDQRFKPLVLDYQVDSFSCCTGDQAPLER